ncbi:MAG: hydrogenase maturation protease [Candidatus Thermoplasmatota archaeon]|nr:hydrogenase maturation protease [Candidatus Thermoplasmatota archaeon]
MSTIVVGVGNPVLGDDGVGIHVVNTLKDLPDGVVLEEAPTGGMNLLDLIAGYDDAILVDAVIVNDMKIGEVCVLDARKMASVHSSNPHEMSFTEALDLSVKLGNDQIPENIFLVGINIEPVSEFSEELSDTVEKAVPSAREKVFEILKKR